MRFLCGRGALQRSCWGPEHTPFPCHRCCSLPVRSWAFFWSRDCDWRSGTRDRSSGGLSRFGGGSIVRAAVPGYFWRWLGHFCLCVGSTRTSKDMARRKGTRFIPGLLYQLRKELKNVSSSSSAQDGLYCMRGSPPYSAYASGTRSISYGGDALWPKSLEAGAGSVP